MWIQLRNKLQKLVEGNTPSHRCIRVLDAACRNLWVSATNGRLAFILSAVGHVPDSCGPQDIPHEVLPFRQQDLGVDLDHRINPDRGNSEWVLNCKVQAKESCDMDHDYYNNRTAYNLDGNVMPDVNDDYVPVTLDVGELHQFLDVVGKKGKVTFFIAPKEDEQRSRDTVPVLVDTTGIAVMMTSYATYYETGTYNEIRSEYLADSKQPVTFQKALKFDSAALLKEMIGAV